MINSNWVFLFPLTENPCGAFTLCVTGQKQAGLAKGDASWSQHVKSTKAHGCLASLCLQALHPSGLCKQPHDSSAHFISPLRKRPPPSLTPTPIRFIVFHREVTCELCLLQSTHEGGTQRHVRAHVGSHKHAYVHTQKLQADTYLVTHANAYRQTTGEHCCVPAYRQSGLIVFIIKGVPVHGWAHAH